MSNEVNKLVKEVFMDLSTALTTGSLDKRLKIGLCVDGSEHGLDVMLQATNIIKKQNIFDLVLISKQEIEGYECFVETCEIDIHTKMEELLDTDYIQGCVTLHYNFPIGVATIGKVVTPATGKEMFIASTTGSTSSSRNQAMLHNTINGIIVAKANGIENPSVGILNVDGARSVERALQALNDNGYPINFASSKRSDGGLVMRGNDLLMGSVDVMVTDSLTGNILMKMFSAYTTGGNYEATGSGYGPGIGENYQRNILIISRASGASVIANALVFAYEMAKGQSIEKNKAEYQLVNKAKFKEISESLVEKKVEQEQIKMPDKEIVTATISGIDVIELDDAVYSLAKIDIYAESGMGCTGPIIMVSENNEAKASEHLKTNNFI